MFRKTEKTSRLLAVERTLFIVDSFPEHLIGNLTENFSDMFTENCWMKTFKKPP